MLHTSIYPIKCDLGPTEFYKSALDLDSSGVAVVNRKVSWVRGVHLDVRWLLHLKSNNNNEGEGGVTGFHWFSRDSLTLETRIFCIFCFIRKIFQNLESVKNKIKCFKGSTGDLVAPGWQRRTQEEAQGQFPSLITGGWLGLKAAHQ